MSAPTEPARPGWTLPGVFGTERWLPEIGRMTTVTVGGDRITLPSDPLTLARLRVRSSACSHPGPYPLAFRFCPECGAHLSEPPAPVASQVWSPPFGGADGLPWTGEPGEPDPATQEEIAVPPASALGFAVAGTPPMLLSCDRTSGWISGWSETGRAWIERMQVPGSTLPAWSWAAGADASGLAVPTDRGAAWISLTAPRRMPVTLLEDHPALGGVGLLRRHAALPVRDGAGVALAVLDRTAPGAGWSLLAVPEAPADLFAAPVAQGDRTIWCGMTGQLILQTAPDGLAAHWRGWRDGMRPLPGVRPVAEPNGALHQLGRLDPRTLVLESLAAPGQVPERRVARGYTPGTGRAVFRENARLRLPWDERAAADYVLPEGCFLLPLLEFEGERFLLALCTGRDRLGRFLGDPAAPDEAEAVHACTLFYSRGPRILEPLDCMLRAGHAWDLSAFVHGGRLHVHGALENRCHRWRLRDAR